MAEFLALLAPKEGIVLTTHFIVSRGVERSRRFYTEASAAVLERSIAFGFAQRLYSIVIGFFGV